MIQNGFLNFPTKKLYVPVSVHEGSIYANETCKYFMLIQPRPVEILNVPVAILDVHGWTYRKAIGAYSKARVVKAKLQEPIGKLQELFKVLNKGTWVYCKLL